ncbi:MAG: leucine-rich repeat domain-containing protein [Tannerellaceae bacterium]|jgi:hypothetical protein|nr:leucine-rich repeat domain-containing protein [Tannerellaceae bacterium]
MKRGVFFLLVSALLSVTANAVTHHVTPGQLSNLLGADITTITDLTLTGDLSAGDFLVLTQMPLLENLNLQEVTVSYNEIPAEAFKRKEGQPVSPLRSIVFPKNLEYIHHNAFDGCIYLTNAITFPSTLRVIGDGAFLNCSSLKNITFSDESSLIEIGNYAFARTGLTSLSLPESLESIGKHAFGNCHDLTGTVTLPADLLRLGTAAFTRCNLTGHIGIPAAINEIPDSAFSFNYHLGSITWEAVTAIGTAAFDSCIGFSVLPALDGIKSIGVAAFRNCTGLNLSINLPETLEVLAQAAFANCKMLHGDVVIPRGVTIIGGATLADPNAYSPNGKNYTEGVFQATGIQTLSFHVGITNIYPYSFANCPSLSGTVRIGNEASFGGTAFLNAGTLNIIIIRHAYVDPINGSDDNDGTSWGKAYRTLAPALSTVGDENRSGNIFLHEGLHLLDNTLTVPNNAHIYGGFVGDEIWGTSKAGTFSGIQVASDGIAFRLDKRKNGVTDPLAYTFEDIEVIGLVSTDSAIIHSKALTLSNASFEQSIRFLGDVTLTDSIAAVALTADSLALDNAIILQLPTTPWSAGKLSIQDELAVVWFNGLNNYPLFVVEDSPAPVTAPIAKMAAYWRGYRLTAFLSDFAWKEGTLYLSTIPQPTNFTFSRADNLLIPGDTLQPTLSFGDTVTTLLCEYGYLTWRLAEGGSLGVIDQYGTLITSKAGRIVIEANFQDKVQQHTVYVATLHVNVSPPHAIMSPNGHLTVSIVTVPDYIPSYYAIHSEVLNPEVARLDGYQLTALRRGVSSYRAWFNDRPEMEDLFRFYVQDVATHVTITGDDFNWIPGRLYTFQAVLDPDFTYAQEVVWTIDNDSAAHIVPEQTSSLSCVIRALREQPVYLTATSFDGFASATRKLGNAGLSIGVAPAAIQPRVVYSNGALHLNGLDGYTVTLFTLAARPIAAPCQVSADEVSITVPSLTAGVYLLTATSPDGKPFTTKLLVR